MKSLLAASGVAALIVSAVVVVLYPSSASSPEAGRFQIIAQANSGNVWVADTSTGNVRLCLPPNDRRQPPECWQWSGAKAYRAIRATTER